MSPKIGADVVRIRPKAGRSSYHELELRTRNYKCMIDNWLTEINKCRRRRKGIEIKEKTEIQTRITRMRVMNRADKVTVTVKPVAVALLTSITKLMRRVMI